VKDVLKRHESRRGTIREETKEQCEEMKGQQRVKGESV
jgi:hypothetical protein